MRAILRQMIVVALTAALGATAGAAQTLSLRRVMRDKLAHAQHMLEAVVTSDWVALQRHTRALQQLTAEPGWAVLKTPEYTRHTTAFVGAVQDLLEAAEARDLDAAPLAYVSLTLTCVQCHRYVARARVAGDLQAR